MKAKFYFGDIVVVEKDQIGVVVKTWKQVTHGSGYYYEIYVRSYNCIKEFQEKQIQRYVVSKEISEEEKAWH